MPWNDEFVSRFLGDCERRQSNGSAHVCTLLSDEVGLSVGAHPELCATCRLRGQPDAGYLGKHAAGLLRQQLRRIALGFFEDHPERDAEIERIFSRAHRWMATIPDGLPQFRRAIVQWVELGRISSQRAEELTQKHAPELLADELPERPEGGRATPAAGADPKGAA